MIIKESIIFLLLFLCRLFCFSSSWQLVPSLPRNTDTAADTEVADTEDTAEDTEDTEVADTEDTEDTEEDTEVADTEATEVDIMERESDLPLKRRRDFNIRVSFIFSPSETYFT